MIKLLIFDLDGTLIDSAADITACVNGLLSERGREPLSGALVRAAIGSGLKTLIARLFPEAQSTPEELEKLEADFMRYYDKHLLDSTVPYPGAREFLQQCDRAIALVTNKYEVFTHKTLRGVGLDHFPWVRVFGSDSLPARKPDPLPLIEAMRAANVLPAETVMIGDGIPDIVAAGRAGVRSIACDYGYTDIDTLMQLGATARLSTFAALPELIRKLE